MIRALGKQIAESDGWTGNRQDQGVLRFIDWTKDAKVQVFSTKLLVRG
ncbi:hypothetical protein [Paenibacillus ferrarius]|nr:hypothetical protein [Paenibacillus ferrarius]